jgi:hypothetical protein
VAEGHVVTSVLFACVKRLASSQRMPPAILVGLKDTDVIVDIYDIVESGG